MKRFYSKFRIALMSFAFGLASVWMFNGLGLAEISVDLPQMKSKSPIIFLLPKNQTEMPFMITKEKVINNGGAGASGGTTCEEARKKLKNKRTKIPNCDF